MEITGRCGTWAIVSVGDWYIRDPQIIQHILRVVQKTSPKLTVHSEVPTHTRHPTYKQYGKLTIIWAKFASLCAMRIFRNHEPTTQPAKSKKERQVGSACVVQNTAE